MASGIPEQIECLISYIEEHDIIANAKITKLGVRGKEE